MSPTSIVEQSGREFLHSGTTDWLMRRLCTRTPFVRLLSGILYILCITAT